MLDFVFCGSELTDSWKRTKLNGKVSDLPDRISSVLNVPLSNINLDGYICNERSYRDLNRLEKMLEDAKSLQQKSLKEKFTTNNRRKRCVPSDSRISPCVSAPSKSLRHPMDQRRTFCFDVIISATIFARRKSAGGNMIGLNQQRKSHASSRSVGGMTVGSFSRTAAGNRAYAIGAQVEIPGVVQGQMSVYETREAIDRMRPPNAI